MEYLRDHRQVSKKNMVILNSGNLPLYEGGEDPKRHWFISTNMLHVMGVTDEVKQMMQLASALRTWALTCFMRFIENHNKNKDDIKSEFLSFFRAQDVKVTYNQEAQWN